MYSLYPSVFCRDECQNKWQLVFRNVSSIIEATTTIQGMQRVYVHHQLRYACGSTNGSVNHSTVGPGVTSSN